MKRSGDSDHVIAIWVLVVLLCGLGLIALLGDHHVELPTWMTQPRAGNNK